MFSISIPPRTTTLNPDAPLESTIGIGRPWWEPIAEWPGDMHFDDVDVDTLAGERELDQGKLGPPPPPAGAYGCTAAWCLEAPLAELELAGPPPRRATVIRRHSLDRVIAGAPA